MFAPRAACLLLARSTPEEELEAGSGSLVAQSSKHERVEFDREASLSLSPYACHLSQRPEGGCRPAGWLAGYGATRATGFPCNQSKATNCTPNTRLT